ncbi:MAG: hypothetical protein Q8Q31_01220 [Nanoarchaeota archaeon]|nr:hypothetical protein [Nanoarchaeota archaeon]
MPKLATSQISTSLLSYDLSNSNDSESGIERTSNASVFVGVYILNLGKFDISTGSFTVDFYLSLKCQVNCSSQEFEFINGRASSFEKIIGFP